MDVVIKRSRALDQTLSRAAPRDGPISGQIRDWQSLCLASGVIVDTGTDELQAALVDAVNEQNLNTELGFRLDYVMSVINTVNVYKISRLGKWATSLSSSSHEL